MNIQKKIEKYIDDIPPIPDTLKKSLSALKNREEDLIKASNILSQDPALMNYLMKIVNKPVFGFKNEITNANQIFGILGVIRVKQILNSYLINLLTPKKWDVFDMDNEMFQKLQVELIASWNKILDSLGNTNQDLKITITLIPATIIICEEIFRDEKENFDLLKRNNTISYNEILEK